MEEVKVVRAAAAQYASRRSDSGAIDSESQFRAVGVDACQRPSTGSSSVTSAASRVMPSGCGPAAATAFLDEAVDGGTARGQGGGGRGAQTEAAPVTSAAVPEGPWFSLAKAVRLRDEVVAGCSGVSGRDSG
ncbi:hypothetical protein SANTM175S_10890 [Streptomyces antimycoticus]